MNQPVSWVLLVLCLVSCQGPAGPGAQPSGPHPSCGEPYPITPLPPQLDDLGRFGFDRYAEVLAPNGKPIRIVAQPGVRDEQVIRARSLLQFFLADAPGSQFGAPGG